MTVEASRIVEHGARRLRPLARRLADTGDAASNFVIERADERLRRRARTWRARRRRASCACPQARRLLETPARPAPNCSSSRAIPPAAPPNAGARSRDGPMPLRGKILNVASATRDKLAANQQISDLVQALGCGTGAQYRHDDLRYEARHHHDRRRRRRRAYRLAAHHFLLPADAAHDRGRASLSRCAIALN